MNYLNTEM